MDLSVIIPTLNEERSLSTTLEDLREQTFQDFEIIIVDGGSKDGTRDIAKKYTDKFFVIKQKGCPVARNYGASRSRSDIIVHTDADCRFHARWLETIHEDVRKHEAEMVWGPVKFHGPISPLMSAYMSLLWTAQRVAWKIAPYTMNPNIAFTKEGFKKIGGYRLDIRYLDDYDIGVRSRKALKTHFNPDNTVLFSSRRYPNTAAIGKDLLKVIRGMAEYHLRNKVSDKHVPMNG